MGEDKRKVLKMLADGVISQEDAERLLEALGEAVDGDETADKAQPENE